MKTAFFLSVQEPQFFFLNTPTYLKIKVRSEPGDIHCHPNFESAPTVNQITVPAKISRTFSSPTVNALCRSYYFEQPPTHTHTQIEVKKKKKEWIETCIVNKNLTKLNFIILQYLNEVIYSIIKVGKEVFNGLLLWLYEMFTLFWQICVLAGLLPLQGS